MKTYDLSDIPLTALTEEDVEGFNFHSTPGALRRAISVNPNFTEPESANVPEITYYQETEGVKNATNPTTWDVEPTYSTHVLDTNVLKFLLKASLG